MSGILCVGVGVRFFFLFAGMVGPGFQCGNCEISRAEDLSGIYF